MVGKFKYNRVAAIFKIEAKVNQIKLAPVAISTYSRVNHLRKGLESLSANIDADKTEVFVFSDAPRLGDEEKVEEVRKFLDGFNGHKWFKSFQVIKRETNNRVLNNRGGIKQLLDAYGRMIFLEEDIVTSPYFLQYMNDGLDVYEPEESVISISAYCPPIRIPKSYPHNVFLLKRFNAWGFGTWKSKFDPFGFEMKESDPFLKSEASRISKYGKDLLTKFNKQVSGKIDAMDVKVIYHQIKYGLYTVYPTASYANNIGHDGTGLHSANTVKHRVKLTQNYIGRIDLIESENFNIVERYRKFRDGDSLLKAVYQKLTHPF